VAGQAGVGLIEYLPAVLYQEGFGDLGEIKTVEAGVGGDEKNAVMIQRIL